MSASSSRDAEALSLVGRDSNLLAADLERHAETLGEIVNASRFLVIGGAGSIGQAVVRELFVREPRKLHVVDISENNLVELVRDLRSSAGYIRGEFATFALDAASPEFDAFLSADGGYDYVLNLSALKHVRSERDPYTLMRLLQTNVFNIESNVRAAIDLGVGRYFSVSTDKAANPVNMMGASKRIMELFLFRLSDRIAVSTARFANVAFSDGSLLHGFNNRLQKRQPIVAPSDIFRYFISAQESGQLCLLAALLGQTRETLIPKLVPESHLQRLSDVALRFVEQHGFEAVLCDSEAQARAMSGDALPPGKWPCYFSPATTTGEKTAEEFFTENEDIDWGRFDALGVIRHDLPDNPSRLDEFAEKVAALRQSGRWGREDLVALFHELLPNFEHAEKGEFLDQRM